MEIQGINSAGEKFDETAVSVKTLIDNLKSIFSKNRYKALVPRLEKYFNQIEDLYNIIFSSNPGKTEKPIIHPGVLFHRSPFINKETGEFFYDKLNSIAKNGLLPIDMLVENSGATDSDYVSFHSVLEGENTLQDIFKRLPQGSIDLIFFINDSPAIEKLIRIGRHNGEDYDPDDLDVMLSNATDEEILKRIFSIGNIYCPDNLMIKGVHYLPIGVPANYISAVVVPDLLLKDEKLIESIYRNFKNAVVIDKNQNKIPDPSKNLIL